MSKEKLPQVYEENKGVFNIPESFITDNPNNYTLGEKLRQCIIIVIKKVQNEIRF